VSPASLTFSLNDGSLSVKLEFRALPLVERFEPRRVADAVDRVDGSKQAPYFGISRHVCLHGLQVYLGAPLRHAVRFRSAPRT